MEESANKLIPIRESHDTNPLSDDDFAQEKDGSGSTSKNNQNSPSNAS